MAFFFVSVGLFPKGVVGGGGDFFLLLCLFLGRGVSRYKTIEIHLHYLGIDGKLPHGVKVLFRGLYPTVWQDLTPP